MLAGDWQLEDRCLLSTSSSPVPFPSTNSSIDKVLYNGVTGAFQKTFTITNNSPTQTIYAFLEGENSRQAPSPYDGTAAFDPFDPSNQEYRGYIGYTDGTNDYAGLPPLSSITITVPLAFWDSGRIVFSTDGADQFSTYGGSASGSSPGAPFYFQDVNTQATYFASIPGKGSNQLQFTPIYQSFDPANGYQPTTATWQSPVASGLFANGQTYIVTGPGLPQGGYTVTIDSSHPGYVTLPGTDTTQTTAGQYIFTAVGSETLGPTARAIEDKFPLTTQGGSPTSNGLVMWYHALTAQAPNNDAPSQLTEFTFRGTFYNPTINPTTGFQYLLGALLPSVDTDSADYDISFVDSISMPVAMEAANVQIPGTTTQAPFGWVGSSQSLAAFQQAVAAFTASNSTGGSNANDLGSYFGGKGYPSYVSIDPGNIKLPSGQNLFLASPLGTAGSADIHFYMKFSDGSTLNEPLYALSSGGTGPSQLGIGGDPIHPSSGDLLGLNTSSMANQYALDNLIAPNIEKGFTYVVSVGNQVIGNAVGMYRDKNGNIIGVKLDTTVPPNAATLSYTFSLAQKDYAGGGIASLWYSWAKYYADNVAATAADLTGTLSGSILTLSSSATGLVPGMAVTGAGVPAGTVVLSVGADHKTIELSQVPAQSASSFRFASPSFASIAGYSPANTPTFDLTFPTAQQAYALAFAQTVYVVMSAWSTTVPAGGQNGWVPLLANIVGGNFVMPNLNQDIVVALTNLSKSALRGVPDFTSPLYSNPEQWYPDPALAAGGQTFNVFNLDPFVWFIHDKLGLSAYAFALDDDIGNVNGGGANQIDISIGGLNRLPNQDPYTATSPWGVVTTHVATAQIRSSTLTALSNPDVVQQIASFDYNQNTPGALVNGPGVPTGTTVQFRQIPAQIAGSNLILSNPLTAASTNGSFAFFGPLVFTGTVLGAGQPADTIILNSAEAYSTLQKLGPIQNLQVTGEGIAPGSGVLVKQISQDPATGTITIALTGNLNPNLVSQPGGFYAYTFGSPVVGLVRDPGFEWANVLGLSDNFNHGAQLSQNTVDWSFTDSKTSAAWFAGIAYDNNSRYTTKNLPAPGGLQVGFVQGDSSISQKVTLGSGTYTLSLVAAQTRLFPGSQSLNVFVDQTLVGNVQPGSTNYDKFLFQFNVGAGLHTITFQGTETSASTVLIDNVALKAGLNLTETPRQRHPVKVEFLSQPLPAGPGMDLGPLRVAVLDRFGQLYSGLTVRVSLVRMGTHSRGHFVRGSVLHARTVNGVATFDHLAISAPGRYVLRAVIGRQRAFSQVFEVRSGQVNELGHVSRRPFAGRAGTR